MIRGLPAMLRRRFIARRAAYWHVRMQHPNSIEEVVAFEVWINADPSHARAYHDVDMLMQSGRSASRSMLTTSEPYRYLRPALATAFVVLLVACSALLFAVPTNAPAYAAVHNQGPAVKAVSLPDGNELVLDVGAHLGIVEVEGMQRIAVYAGRARATVSVGTKPISLMTASREVTLYGGTVDVLVDGDATSLHAVDDPVSVTVSRIGQPPQDLSLRVGEALRWRASHFERAKLDVDESDWPSARRAFDGVALSDVIALANKHSDVPIVIADSGTASLRVSGLFDLRDTRKLATQLAAAFGLRATDQDGHILIGPAS